MPQHWYFSKLHVVDAPAELPPSAPIGMIYETLEPLTLYAYTASGWVPLASLAGAALPAVGNHNLYSTTHPDVAGVRDDGEVLVWRPSPSSP
jgi:hypothetical protein